MNQKGKVSTLSSDGKMARIILVDKGIVTPELPMADHVSGLEINDMVAVAFFSVSLADGVIIARW